MDQLDSLNYATDTLCMQAPAVVQRVLPQSPTQQVHDDQCNKSVQISTHQQNTQPTTNSNPTHPELHIDVKPQSNVSMVTASLKELQEGIGCRTPVIKQSSLVSLESPIDQSGLHVKSTNTMCTAFTHTSCHNAPCQRCVFCNPTSKWQIYRSSHIDCTSTKSPGTQRELHK